MSTTPKSFRLRPETLAQLDRLTELLTIKLQRQHQDRSDDPALTFLNDRAISQTEALAVAISDALQRLEREAAADAPAPRPHRAAADAGRGLLADLPGGSLTDELLADRRAEAGAEDAGVTVTTARSGRQTARRRRST